MTEKRKKRAEKRRRINAESKKYNTCFYVDKEEWESLDRPGITIVDGDGSPMAKYESVPIDEDEEEICYFHRIDAEMVRVIWAEEENAASEDVSDEEGADEEEEEEDEVQEVNTKEVNTKEVNTKEVASDMEVDSDDLGGFGSDEEER